MAKKIKKRSISNSTANSKSSFASSTTNSGVASKPVLNPAVSIVIPLYNAAEYIGECLESILAQTFQNFEVIVVDDCSTDNSLEVVKEYIPRFKEQIKIVKTKENSGSPGAPGNIGVDLSRGEYVFILDNDDTITTDALEKLYNDAKAFNADVVTCEKFYWVPLEKWNDEDFRRNLEPTSYQKGELVTEPALVPFDIAQRVQDCYDHKFLWSLWQKLIRRDYLIKNDIRFTDNIIQDMVATCCLVYTAERLVRVPYAVNFYRVNSASLFRRNRNPLQQLQTYLNVLNVGLKYLDEFLSKREFFRKNPYVKYMALNTYFREIWDKYIQEFYDRIPVADRADVLRKEFADNDNTDLMSFLFDVIFNSTRERVNYLTARIDFKFVTTATNAGFKILSVSGDNVKYSKPKWFQTGGIGYVFTSTPDSLTAAGALTFVVKATADGQIDFQFKATDVHDPKDNSKRIPCWIDYTALTVNEETIFDEVKPAWHDEPYEYSIKVKADEEITVHVKWSPHIEKNS